MTRWWFQRFFIFTPILVEDEAILTCAYFSDGWGGSTTTNKPWGLPGTSTGCQHLRLRQSTLRRPLVRPTSAPSLATTAWPPPCAGTVGTQWYGSGTWEVSRKLGNLQLRCYVLFVFWMFFCFFGYFVIYIYLYRYRRSEVMSWGWCSSLELESVERKVETYKKRSKKCESRFVHLIFIKIPKKGALDTSICPWRWSIWIWVSRKDCGGHCMIIKVIPSIHPMLMRRSHTSGSFFLLILWPKICATDFLPPKVTFAGHVESWQTLYLKNIMNSKSLALQIQIARTKWTMLSSTGSWHTMRNKRVLKVNRCGLNSIKTLPFMNWKALQNCVFAAESVFLFLSWCCCFCFCLFVCLLACWLACLLACFYFAWLIVCVLFQKICWFSRWFLGAWEAHISCHYPYLEGLSFAEMPGIISYLEDHTS